VLVFICIGSRRIEYVACTSTPDGAWMLQARNLLMNLDDHNERPRLLIHDRDAKFQPRFRRNLQWRRDQGDPNTSPGAERERAHRALGRQRTARVPRPDPDLQPPPTGASSTSTSGITTNDARTGRSIYKRLTRAGELRRTASPRPRRFDDATYSADSSTNTKPSPHEIQ
jgi:hypothetical protein